jgi:hypothetical protein
MIPTIRITALSLPLLSANNIKIFKIQTIPMAAHFRVSTNDLIWNI